MKLLNDLIARAVAAVVEKCGPKEGHEPMAVAEVVRDVSELNPGTTRAMIYLAVEEVTCKHGNPGTMVRVGMAGDTRILEVLLEAGNALVAQSSFEAKLRQSNNPRDRLLGEIMNALGGGRLKPGELHTNQTFRERYGSHDGTKQ